MYQPYPSSGQTPESQRPPMPASVHTAVRLMYVGAGRSFIAFLVGLVTIGSVKAAIIKAYPHYTARQVHSLEVASIGIGVLVGVVAIALWLWMARRAAALPKHATNSATGVSLP